MLENIVQTFALLTVYVQSHLELIPTSCVGGNTGVETGIVFGHGIKDERIDSGLVDDDLVQSVLTDLEPFPEPRDVRQRTTVDDAIEPGHVTFWYGKIGWYFTEDRFKVLLRNAS